MAIENPMMSTTPLSEVNPFIVTFVTQRPQAMVYLDPPLTPRIVVGYYNDTLKRVELFVTSPDGRYYIRIVS